MPRRKSNLVKLSPLAFLVLIGLLMTGPATAAPISPPHSAPSREVKATLQGPRQVVVRDLPPAAATATGQAQEVLASRRFPPGWAAGPLSPAPATNALDAAFSAESESNTPPTVSTAEFDGLDNNDNGPLTGLIVRPPDPQMAVGPDHVFEMVNIVGRIYSRTGATLQSFSLRSFFGVPANYSDTDPKIIYDALSGRWFASYVSYINGPGPNDEGRLHLAISQTSDPTGVWNVYDRLYSQVLPDYAGIGVTDDKFTISSNIFDIDARTNPYRGEETVVFEKADVLAGVAAGDLGLFAFPRNLSRFTVRPAHSLSAVDDQYLVTRSGSSSTTLVVIRVTGTPDAGNVTEASATNLTIISQTAPPDSVTAEGGAIDSGDQRLLDAMWRQGSLWMSASAACVPTGDSTTRSCAHLIEVNATPPTTPTIAQDIMFGASGEYFSWPAVRTDASGDVYVSLTHTNSTIFAEARAAGRLAGELPNTMSGSTLLRAGEALYTGGRWGDYLAVAVDPNLPECVWMVGQYTKDITFGGSITDSDWNWGTYIAATSYSGGCDSDSDGWTDSAEQFIGTDPTLCCSQTPAADDEDPDPVPPDPNDNQVVGIDDIFFASSRFNQASGDANYAARAEIASQDGVIGIDDIFGFAGRFNQTS